MSVYIYPLPEFIVVLHEYSCNLKRYSDFAYNMSDVKARIYIYMHVAHTYLYYNITSVV